MLNRQSVQPQLFTVIASLLASCGGAPDITNPPNDDIDSMSQPATSCPNPRLEMANFCQKWDQLPGGQIALDVGTGGVVELNYKLIGISANRTAYTQGDIVLGDENSLAQARSNGTYQGRTEGVGRISRSTRWPNGRVPYVIDPSLPNPKRVTDAIAEWQKYTFLEFFPRDSETDYILFKTGGGCSSWVGRAGGEQAVTLNAGCTTGNTIHEIGHALGLWHEQSRTDRDEFIVINFNNIEPSYWNQFDTIVSPLVENGNIAGYNFNSVMHYPPDAFAVDGSRPAFEVRPGISLLPGVVMGQRNGLSQGDITAINLVYCEEPDYPCVIPVKPSH